MDEMIRMTMMVLPTHDPLWFIYPGRRLQAVIGRGGSVSILINKANDCFNRCRHARDIYYNKGRFLHETELCISKGTEKSKGGELAAGHSPRGD